MLKRILLIVLMAAAFTGFVGISAGQEPADVIRCDEVVRTVLHRWVKPAPPSSAEREDHVWTSWRAAEGVADHKCWDEDAARRLYRFYWAVAYRESCGTFDWHDNKIGWGPLACQRHEVLNAAVWLGRIPPEPRRKDYKGIKHQTYQAAKASWDRRAEAYWQKFLHNRVTCVWTSVGHLARLLEEHKSKLRLAAVHHNGGPGWTEKTHGKYIPGLLYRYETLWAEPMPWYITDPIIGSHVQGG
jgi:hypothetical protein